jgi:beta-lactam-binding protein with PASTA domain
MRLSAKKIFSSPISRRVYLFLALLLVLFFLCNDFIIPWYVNQGGIVEVPSMVGLEFSAAKNILDSLHLEGRKADVRMDNEHPAGVVIIQNPAAGEKVKRGRRIYLTVSGGELDVNVPDIKGRTVRDTKFVLEREGLLMGTMEYQPSDSFPQNTIIEQHPSPGTKTKRESYVSVIVSQGSVFQKVAVPDLAGKTFKEANSILFQSGLKVGNITYLPSADLLPNTIIEQYPRAGEMVINGQAIDLFIVQGGEQKKEILEN